MNKGINGGGTRDVSWGEKKVIKGQMRGQRQRRDYEKLKKIQ